MKADMHRETHLRTCRPRVGWLTNERRERHLMNLAPTLAERLPASSSTAIDDDHKMKIFAELGIDRLMCFHVGSLPHDKVMKSIRLVGEMIPELDARPPDRRDQGPGQRS